MKYRIKERLQAAGMTAKDLSDIIGITANGFSMAMRKGFTISRLEQIATALNCRVADLLDEPSAPERPFAICPHCGKKIYLESKTE